MRIKKLVCNLLAQAAMAAPAILSAAQLIVKRRENRKGEE